MDQIRVLIAEDHFITRVCIETIVAAQPDMAVIGAAINGAQALSLYPAHRPDVTLMDMYMPSDGFNAVAAIHAEFPGARIIALSTFAADEDIRRAMNAGAQTYLTKDVLHDELIAAIRTVHGAASTCGSLPHPRTSRNRAKRDAAYRIGKRAFPGSSRHEDNTSVQRTPTMHVKPLIFRRKMRHSRYNFVGQKPH